MSSPRQSMMLILPTVLSLGLLAYVIANRPDERTMRQGEMLAQVQTLIADHYYRDPLADAGAENLTEDERAQRRLDALYYAAMRGMVAALDDPYSAYQEPSHFATSQRENRGTYAGLGMTVNMDAERYVRILSPMPKSPAMKAGLRPGDRILRIDGADARVPEDESLNDLIVRLRGEPGAEVTLDLRRRDEGERFTVTLTYAKVVAPSVVDVHFIDEPNAPPRTGYLRVNGFKANTAREFSDAVKSLHADGLDTLIIDLRFNGGGYLNAVRDIVDGFLPAGKTIVYTAGRNPRYDESIVSTDARHVAGIDDVALVVLVTRLSASASEIFVGALQDYGRALIVGETTLGKGLVQNVFTLQGGPSGRREGVKITTARYFTPAGRCIQRDDARHYRGGVEPDVKLVLQYDPQHPNAPSELAGLLAMLRDREILGGPPWYPEGTGPAPIVVDRQLELALRIIAGERVAVPAVQANDHPRGSFAHAIREHRRR